MLRILLSCALVTLVLGEPAQAQLDLPRPGTGRGRQRPRPRGDLAPHLECTICHERDYQTPRETDSQGFQRVFCRVCQKQTLHKDPAVDRKRQGGSIELPSNPPRGTRGASGAKGAGSEPAGGTSAPSSAGGATGASASPGLPLDITDQGRAASFVFSEVERLQDPEDGLVHKAVESLINFGEAGRMASRVKITSDHGPTILTAARVLLASGVAPDAEAVTRRVQGRLPNRVCKPIVRALVETDPVHGSPAFLCKLLDHRQGSMRSVAEEHLEDMLSSDLLPHLETVLDSRRSDARARAVRLLEQLDDPEAVDVLLAHVGDPTATVAWEITEALAASSEKRIDAELLSLAFRERWILRREAYALLTIVEREDRHLEPILDPSHIDPLLAGLASRDPFVSGASAAALAGLGFRSPTPEAAEWLDRDVPDRLVYALSGREFHNDYSSLQRPVLRRLQRITGETYGTDGPAWAEWWLAARTDFYARRAWISFAPGDEVRLSLRFRRGGMQPALFTLLGPEADAGAAGLGETLRLGPGGAADLLRLCEREGVFGPERLPGVRGGRGSSERSLEVRIGAHGKEFIFGPSASEPWFERVVTIAEELRERNRWQRYLLVDEAAGDAGVTRASVLEQEGAWWAEPHDDLERALRLKVMVMRWLPSQRISDRDGAVSELVRLYEVPGVAQRSDFDALVGLLDTERFLAERAREILQLALDAARSGRGETEAGDADLVDIEREDAFELVRVLHDRFGPTAAKELASVFEATGREFTREMAASDRSLMRIVAAAALADDPDEEDVRTLLVLLGDEDPAVEVAAILALGQERIETARTELLVRSRAGRPQVRKAALRAVGKLGGEYVMEALLLGLANDDEGIRLAAADGLADLGDPRGTAYLIQFLQEPPDSKLFEAGRRGLTLLGEAARDDLLRVLHTPEHPGRRSAAILLAEQGVPQAVPALIRLLSEDDDRRVSRELVVLTCVDFREREEPARAWWDWWDSVLHDDSLAWFRAALERFELDPPPPAAFREAANMDTARYLLGLFERDEEWLVERARRELERVLGRRITTLPPPGPERERWLSVASSWIEQSSAQDADR